MGGRDEEKEEEEREHPPINNTKALYQWDGVGGGGEGQERVDICIPMADSGWCITETNIIL